MDEVISIKNAIKSFGKLKVLDGVSLECSKGKIYGIVGRNGSGKTVLFKAICGFLMLDSGTICVNNKIVGKDIDMPRNIGTIIETPGFLPNYSGYKNLKYLADLNGSIGKDEIKDVMRRVGLDPDIRRHVSKYSLGMRQRLSIAQAIMEKQDILVLDEPMNGLDNDGVNDIRELLLYLKEEGKTIILASHNKEDISVLCDEVYTMNKGRLE